MRARFAHLYPARPARPKIGRGEERDEPLGKGDVLQFPILPDLDLAVGAADAELP